MQRKYAVAMGALFTALIEGCVARIPVGSDADSGSESADATGTSTSGPNTTSTSGPMTSTSGPDTWPTTDPSTDPTSDPCGDDFIETSEIDASLVAGYDVGQSLPLDVCTAVC